MEIIDGFLTDLKKKIFLIIGGFLKHLKKIIFLIIVTIFDGFLIFEKKNLFNY